MLFLSQMLLATAFGKNSLCALSCADLALGTYLSRLLKRDLGEERSEQLVDENGEERYVCNDHTVSTECACLHSHSKCNARLRQKGYSQIIDDVLLATNSLGASPSSEILSGRARHYVDKSDNDYRRVGEYRKLKRRF